MLKKLLLITIILLGFIKVKAQENFILYNNDTERLLLKGANNSDDCLKLVLASEMSDVDARKYFGNLINDAKQIGAELDKIAQTEKKVQKLQQVLHGSYLKNYNPTATFADVFNSGSYCGPHAALLYAWFLDQYHIPYEVREEPGKLYVLAYPLTSKIELEGIDANVYRGPDDAAIQKYVLDLIKLKYIDEAYLRQEGTQRAFANFFYVKGNLGVKSLAGFAYFSRAEVQLQLNNADKAYSDAMKAFILTGQKKCEVLQKGILLEMISTLKYRDLRDWEAATYALNNIAVSDDQKKYLKYEYEESIQDLLWKQSKPDLEEQIHAYVSTNLKDTTFRNEIDQEYYTQAGRYNYTIGKYADALQDLAKVLAKNPNNVLVKQAAVEILFKKVLSQNSGSVHNIAALDQAVKDFPFFAGDPSVQRLYIYNYAFLAETAFTRTNKEEGEKYLKLMCSKLMSIKPDPQIDVEQTGMAFVKASDFYYNKQNNKQKALQVLNDGLKYSPNSIYITQQINYIKQAKPAVKQSSAYDKLKIFNQ